MKLVTKPMEQEESVYYSDFSGKLLKDFVPVTVKIECDYGSKYDGSALELHLTDKGLESLLAFLKQHLCEETKQELQRQFILNEENKTFYKNLI